MPFSSLKDPVDIARAHAALERAWQRIHSQGIPVLGSEEAERQRLAYIVAALVMTAEDEDDLVQRAVEKFKP